MWTSSFLLIAAEVANLSVFCCTGSLSCSSQRVTQRRPGEAFTCSRLHYRRGILGLGDIDVLQLMASMPVCRSSSVQLLSRVRLFATPWTAARRASLLPPRVGLEGDAISSSKTVSRLDLSSKVVCHIVIFEKINQSRSQSMPCLEGMQKVRRPKENRFPI